MIVVIGGGVIGAACAHYLVEAGHRVTIVDRGRFGAACSHANCGLVCPSHVLPLSEPGAIGEAFRSLFRPRGPLAVKLRWDPALWKWFWRFARRCNEADMLESGEACRALLDASRSLYDRLISDHELECEWETRGLLFAYRDRRAFEHFAQLDALLAERFERPAERWEAEQLVEREPALREGLAGGWHYPGDAHLRSDRLMESWKQRLQQRGVQILEHRSWTDLQGTRSEAHRVCLDGGDTLSAEQVVVATGAWTPLLRHLLRWSAPIQPGKGYSLTLARPRNCPSIPIIFPGERVAVTPTASAFRLGSIMEFAGYNRSVPEHRRRYLLRAAGRYLRELPPESTPPLWYGWRPMTADGKPYIGRVPGWDNVWAAAGHNMLGLSMAPSTGQLVRELMDGVSPHLDPEPYRLDRHASKGGERKAASTVAVEVTGR